MTVESALAKLSFVMGKEALTREDRKMVSFTSRFEARYLKTNAGSGDFWTHLQSQVFCVAQFF